MICAEANDAATGTAHRSHKAFLANKVTDLEAICISFHDFTNFTLWHGEGIEGFSLAGRKKHLFKPRQHIVGECSHLHFGHESVE